MSGPAAAAGDPPAGRVLETFLELARIVSPPKRERRAVDHVVAALAELGIGTTEDDAGARTGGDAGNVLARLAATGPGEPLLLCAHVDTIDPGPVVRPVVVDGRVRAAEGAVLGADNKAAVAGILDGMGRVLAARLPHPAVELLFTVQEELGLAGASCFDSSSLTARQGYLFDIGGAVGGMVVAAPTHRVVTLDFNGRAAHASQPEDGVSAVVAAADFVAGLPPGRVDDRTTLNVGTFHGGGALNVVAETARVELEVRSLDDQGGDDLVTELVEQAGRCASARGGQVRAEVSVSYRAYRHEGSNALLNRGEAALRGIGAEPYTFEHNGGSDANVLNAAGVPSLNLACGMEAIHSADESIAVADLQRISDLVVALVASPGGHD